MLAQKVKCPAGSRAPNLLLPTIALEVLQLGGRTMPGLRILTSWPIRKKLLLLLLFIFLPAAGIIIVSGLSNLSILGIAALSAMLLAWLFGNFTFVAPIKQLVAAAQLFGRGELGTRTGLPHTPDEFGQLAKSFDEMASLLEMRSIEHKRAEKELKDSEQQLRSIIQGYPIPAFVIGEDHQVVYWNKALEEMSKIKANEVVGTSEHWRAFYREKRPCMADLLVDENQEGAVRWYGERTGKSEALNEAYEATEFVTCLGETGKWLHFTAAALRNSRGTIVGAIETLEDITDREKAEEVLRESENRYRAIFENTGAATIILEEDTTISLANAEFEKLTGYTKDEIENKKSWTEYVAKEDLERMLDQHRLRRVDAKAALKQYEFRLIDRHDQTRDCLLTVDMIADTKRSIASFLDITERKNAEKALHESELRLRTILQTVNEGFWLIDNDTVTTDLNPRMCAILGRNREEVLGRKIFDFVDSENKAIFEQQIRLRAQGEVGTYEIALSRPDGSNVFCLFNATPLFDGSGNKAGSFAMVTDISERKLAEIALRESEERFARFFRSTPVGTSITRFSDGQFADINDAFLVLFGYIREEVIGQNALKLGMWANPQDRAKMFEVLQEQGRLQDFETMFRRKSGEIMDVLISAEVIEMAGQQYMLCLTHDITERKRAEEERRGLEDRLQRAEKMEALGTLAGGVAHDLNNVLGIVVGYSELLVDELIESGSARSKALEILKGGQRAGAIVQDLLTLARRGVSNRKALNLNNIVLEFLDSPEFAGISSYHPNIRLKTDLEAHLLNISGSAVHLSKSLMNLVSNAAEAMPQGGVITIKTGNQYLDKPVSGYDEVRESDYVVLSVSDMGQGIPANDMKRIFEPFYTKKVMGRSGTGLGLAVIWGTVKDHLGYINVGSQEGKGTTFTLYFPVTREEISREQVSISAAEYMGNGESILIVDDVKEQRELAGTMLEKLNYTVVTVSSGEEAVEYLKQNAVDLLVLDMIMDPGMDGLDTYAKVLEIHPRQRAIIVSGFSETKRVSRAQALGAGAYVKKPYLLEKLGLAVRKELDQPA